MRRRAGTVAGLLGTALLVLAAPAGAVVKKVDIEPTKFTPAVITVGPGTDVEWTNKDGRTRALRGDFSSTDIVPGQTYKRRFSRIGRFDYRDRDNPLLTGTVIVTVIYAGGRPRYPRPGGTGLVTHHWRGTLRLDIREDWKYMDGKFLSFAGPCNAQVGDGSRQAQFSAAFPDVKYSRVGGLEVLSGKSRPYGIQGYRETIASKTSDPNSGRDVDCGDGSRDPPADVEQNCNHNYAGYRVRAELLWSPRVARGRFQWPHEYLSRRPPSDANCGHSYLAASALSGLNNDLLPWDPGAGSGLLYDHGRTNPVTLAEARALRNGRAVTITREIELHFTVDCCVEWHEEGKPGTYVRVGARHNTRGRVTIRLTPR